MSLSSMSGKDTFITIIEHAKIRSFTNVSCSSGHYDNGALVKEIKRPVEALSFGIKVEHENGFIKMTAPPKKTYEIKFKSTKLRSMLSLNHVLLSDGKPQRGLNQVDVGRGLPSQMYVHSNIVEHQHVNNSLDRLLRVMPFDVENYTYGRSRTHTFSNLQYVNVNRQHLVDIDFLIKDSAGQFIPFESGTLTVVLHFRKVRDE